MATRSFARSYACTVHSFTCSALHFVHALVCSLAHSLAPELVMQRSSFLQFSNCPESLCVLLKLPPTNSSQRTMDHTSEPYNTIISLRAREPVSERMNTAKRASEAKSIEQANESAVRAIERANKFFTSQIQAVLDQRTAL